MHLVFLDRIKNQKVTKGKQNKSSNNQKNETCNICTLTFVLMYFCPFLILYQIMPD